FRLTRQGFNFLALRELTNSKVIKSLGSVIGVGKESEVYSVEGEEDSLLCIKFHILGEQSFRQVKKKRDFHKRNDFLSRFELSRKSAEKEFLYLEKLYKKGFPVPQPIKNNRHAVVMEYIHGEPLYVRRKELRNPGKLYRECMDLIVQFAHLGLIHGDFNEFNLLLDEDGDGDLFYYDDWKLYVFDLPQVVSVRHENAEEYFDRDVDCIRIFFKKRFHYECDDYPQFKDVLGKRSPDPDHVNEDDDDVEDDHDDDAATIPLDDLRLENDDENDDCLDVES
ncbi:hypothetical protein HELRODRAFT_87132, partial [Helobdella robusta]|uniref:non-specific serine/threonine protein kinase n=1 Tax=Helobdella robusta TaxID=6412 RepID=T1G6M1_HELRO